MMLVVVMIVVVMLVVVMLVLMMDYGWRFTVYILCACLS